MEKTSGLHLPDWFVSIAEVSKEGIGFVVQHTNESRNFKESNLIRVELGNPQSIVGLTYFVGEDSIPNLNALLVELREAEAKFEGKEFTKLDLPLINRSIDAFVYSSTDLGDAFDEIFQRHGCIERLRLYGGDHRSYTGMRGGDITTWHGPTIPNLR